jgi:large subunit ribosomal protein L21
MFAIVRTGGKQYRVAAGDKITVEKLAGSVGDKVELADVLLAGDGTDLKSTAGMIVGAEIIAQGKGEKIIIFKKKRRHNYRRKNGHRQFHTLLKIVSIGGEAKKAAPKKAEAAPAEASEAAPKKAPVKKTPAKKDDAA